MMRKSLRQAIGILNLVTILFVSVLVCITSEKLSQVVDIQKTVDMKKKVAERLGIEERDLGLGGIDSNEQYGVWLARHFEEVFLVIWELTKGEVVYTTRGKNRYPIALTWVGQKLVYIAYDGIRFTYELDLPHTKKLKKVFLVDPITCQDKVLNIPPGTAIYTCGDDIVLMSYPLGLPPDYTTRMIWYSVSKETKIQEWTINVWNDFRAKYPLETPRAYVAYCTPDHKRIWVVTFVKGPKLPYTGYAPTPVPVLVIVTENQVKMLMNPEKEWLEIQDVHLLHKNTYEVFAAITIKAGELLIEPKSYLVHFSPKGELWRKELNKQEVIKKGFKDFYFLRIGQDGQKILCQEYKGEKRLFWWDIINKQVKVVIKSSY